MSKSKIIIDRLKDDISEVEYTPSYHESKIEWFKKKKGESVDWNTFEDFFSYQPRLEDEDELWSDIENGFNSRQLIALSEINRSLLDLLLLMIHENRNITEKEIREIEKYIKGNKKKLDLNLPEGDLRDKLDKMEEDHLDETIQNMG